MDTHSNKRTAPSVVDLSMHEDVCSTQILVQSNIVTAGLAGIVRTNTDKARCDQYKETMMQHQGSELQKNPTAYVQLAPPPPDHHSTQGATVPNILSAATQNEYFRDSVYEMPKGQDSRYHDLKNLGWLLFLPLYVALFLGLGCMCIRSCRGRWARHKVKELDEESSV
ncbi:hypothetical protein F4808DRAFT_471703 [Astrocystis sublimbata]|nr:hypothetical protein F4808DRAFT_471703 [Astrocystis sublimbata]